MSGRLTTVHSDKFHSKIISVALQHCQERKVTLFTDKSRLSTSNFSILVFYKYLWQLSLFCFPLGHLWCGWIRWSSKEGGSRRKTRCIQVSGGPLWTLNSVLAPLIFLFLASYWKTAWNLIYTIPTTFGSSWLVRWYSTQECSPAIRCKCREPAACLPWKKQNSRFFNFHNVLCYLLK